MSGLPVVDAYWECTFANNQHKCFHKCTSGPLADQKTGASAVCNTTGKKADKWVIRKKSSANCIPCNSDPISKFPIGGDGQWQCKGATSRKCTIKCPTGKKVTGSVTCNRKTSPADENDAWSTKQKKTDWTCATPPLCPLEDVSAQLDKYLAKKYPSSQYSYAADDFVFKPENSKCLVSANLICPTNDNKVARVISFCCKGNQKGTKSVWKFKGDPAQDPNKVKCALGRRSFGHSSLP